MLLFVSNKYMKYFLSYGAVLFVQVFIVLVILRPVLFVQVLFVRLPPKMTKEFEMDPPLTAVQNLILDNYSG